MSKLLKSKIALASLLFASAAVYANPVVYSDPIVSFTPQVSTVELGKQFKIDVTISGILDLYKYSLSVGYNADCITPVNVTEGSFLKQFGPTDFVKGTVIPSGSMGEIHNMTNTLVGNIPAAIGEGVLFTVEFKAIAKCDLAQSYLTMFKQSILGKHGSEPRIDYHEGMVEIVDAVIPPPGPSTGLLVDGLLKKTGAIILDGDVYVWGNRGSSQQGNGVHSVHSKSAPQKVSSLRNVTDLTSGFYHLIALDKNGDVWGWGQNIYGEAGCAKTYASTPCKVLSNATQIAAGALFSAALDANGQVWTWGHNTYGQLGNGGKKHSKVPVAVNLNGEKARLIGGAYEGVFAVTEEGHVWAWGDNEASGLGIQGSKFGHHNIVRSPVRIANLEVYADQIVQISGGNGWAEALLDDGRVIGWGLHKAIGQNQSSLKVSGPEPILIMNNAAKLFARYYGSVVLTNDNEIYTWGKHTHSFPMVYGKTPTFRWNVKGKPTAIGGGKKHIFYQNDLGEIYGIGYNDHYKLDQSKLCGSINWPGAKLRIK